MFNALGWERRFEIVAACGAVSRTIWLLQTYLGQLTIVARAGGYFRLSFKGYHSVTQGEPCPQFSSIWLWKPSFATGWQWWLQPRMVGRVLACRYGNFQRISMTTMASPRRPNCRDCRGHLTSFPASSTRLASVQTQVRRSVCYASHATRLTGCLCRCTSGGRWGRGQPSGGDSGVGWNSQSSDWRLRRGR